jgi:hypothetical protein
MLLMKGGREKQKNCIKNGKVTYLVKRTDYIIIAGDFSA